jgi:hypothetical protein
MKVDGSFHFLSMMGQGRSHELKNQIHVEPITTFFLAEVSMYRSDVNRGGLRGDMINWVQGRTKGMSARIWRRVSHRSEGNK